MTYRDVRGSFYSAARQNETQSGLPASESRYVGFRLVFDGEQRKAQGAPWTIPEPEGLGALNRPHSSGRTVGFRLAKEEK